MSRQPALPFRSALLQMTAHFSSGINTSGDFRGFAGSFRHAGITATDVRDGLLATVGLYAGTLQRLFVDTGAFGEVEFGPNGPEAVKPITDAAWDRIFTVLLWGAVTYGKRAYLVAPDRVGCQLTTLARMARYAGRVQLLVALGAQIIIPVQKGELAMSAMFRRSVEILGLDNAIAGVPMKKDATSLGDLRELVSSLPRYARIHLLGLGPESRRFAGVIELITSLRPDAEITSDSATLRRLVGRTNGAGGGPRILTKLQDEVRATGAPSIGIKAESLWVQGAIEVGFDRRTESQALILRNGLRVELDEESAVRAAARQRPQLCLLSITEAA